MIPNHYYILELEPTATKKEIKKAYRRLALKYHPDKNKSPDAHEKFININEAYLILNDDEAKLKYDREYQYCYDKKVKTESANSQKEQEKKQEEAKSSYKKQKEPQFEDEDLNQWSRNARQQAESFAKMAFADFSKLIFSIVKETGFQLGNAFLIILGALLSMGGCSNIVVSISTKGEIGNPILDIILIPIGVIIYLIAYKNYDNHKV